MIATATQIDAFQENGFVVIDGLLTDEELDEFEPLVTAAVAMRSWLGVPAMRHLRDQAH